MKHLIITLPLCAIALIVLFIYHRRRDGRVQEFTAQAEAEMYTCPVCRMANDAMKPCERCGFDPYTKEGGEDYEDEDVKQFLTMLTSMRPK